MNRVYELFLDALRCAVHGNDVSWHGSVSSMELRQLERLSREHSVFPLLMEAIYASPAVAARHEQTDNMIKRARRLCIAQAKRTAEFLMLHSELKARGLDPVMMKGIICRSLYPESEQRASVDEDILVKRSDLPSYHEAMLACGLTPVDRNEPEDAYEVAYQDKSRGLYIEVHADFFSPDSAYSDCNVPLSGALERSVAFTFDGTEFRTLAPTDHLIFLILHAYKHFLHGGVGIRQVCDINLFAEKYGPELDAEMIVRVMKELHTELFAAALFRIGEKYLGFAPCAMFAAFEIDECALLDDILSGGLYGVNDIDRAHSSTITLDAVAASRSGRRSRGALHSVFLPLKEMKSRYPYLRRRSWLLPVAWADRIIGYITHRDGKDVDPSRTIRIGKDRVALLKEYGIIK